MGVIAWIRSDPVPLDVEHSRDDAKVFGREGIIRELHIQRGTKCNKERDERRTSALAFDTQKSIGIP